MKFFLALSCTIPSLFYLFVLRLDVPVNNFSVMSGRSHRFPGINLQINTYLRDCPQILTRLNLGKNRLTYPAVLPIMKKMSVHRLPTLSIASINSVAEHLHENDTSKTVFNEKNDHKMVSTVLRGKPM